MNQFINAIQIEDNKTLNEKGALAYKSTLNANLDLFGKIGVPNDEILYHFYEAKIEDKAMAYKILLWSRDIINGAGLRKNYISILKSQKPEKLREIVLGCIERGIGYWKDLIKIDNEDLFQDWAKAIENGDRLAAKWFPRKGKWFNMLADLFESKSLARKFLVKFSDTVEQKVCAKDFESINYSHVPSKAMKLHANTFNKFDGERFNSFINKVISGEETIKAKALYPYEIIAGDNDWNVKQAQWNNLPDFVEEGISYLPVIDCSGSMTSTYRNLVAPIDVAHSLGIYCSERNKSVFKDKLLTFSARPHWVTLQGDLQHKVNKLQRFSEVENTNLDAVFSLILKTAVDNKVSQEDLPNYLLLISDGQFDEMVNSNSSGWYRREENDYDTIFQKYEKLFHEAGYVRPNIVFWNVSDASSSPFTIMDKNVTTVSGNAPSVMKFIGNPDPIKLMMEAVEPYKWVEEYI